jgi:3-dehydroquinate dehydratase
VICGPGAAGYELALDAALRAVKAAEAWTCAS